MLPNLDNSFSHSNSSLLDLFKLIGPEKEKDNDSIRHTLINNSQISEFQSGCDNLYFQKHKDNGDNKINSLKNEEQNNKKETFKFLEYEETEGKDFLKKNLNKIRVNFINRLLELNQKGEYKPDGIQLFEAIDALIDYIKEEFVDIMSKIDNLTGEKINKITMLMQKIDYLKEIKEFKIKEKDEKVENNMEVLYLKEKLILFEEEVEKNIEIRKEIQKELGDNSNPIKTLNIAIEKFIIHCFEKAKEYFLKKIEEENKRIKTEIVGKKFLEKKRKHSENDDEEKSNSEKSANIIKRQRYRSDNLLNMVKRNLVQKIFLDWINNEEDKNNRLAKLDPTTIKTFSELKGKKLKEIYSQKISVKPKLDKDHNINIIEMAKGIKNIKLNFSFEQALQLFFYQTIDEKEILELVKNIKDDEKIIVNEDHILKGLKSKEEFINEKSEDKKPSFEKKLRNVLDEIEKNYLL